jgi:dTDP-4-amino-4,6-dideoxygalactose transaminase
MYRFQECIPPSPSSGVINSSISERLKIDRNQFMKAMKAENIGTGIHFIAVHLQPYYKKRYKSEKLPNAEFVSERIVSLPLYPKMTDKDVQEVIAAVKKIISYYKR